MTQEVSRVQKVPTIPNYLLGLPEDIQTLIYKAVFTNTLKDISGSNNKSLYDFYEVLCKSKLLFADFADFADSVDFVDSVDSYANIYLHRKIYTRPDSSLAKIKYIEYPIKYFTNTYFTMRFQYCKTILEDFAPIIYNDVNVERINYKLQRQNSGIYRVQYKDKNSLRIFIDKNKLLCRADLEKTIIFGYELLYYSFRLIDILKLNTDDYHEDIIGLYRWIANHNYLDGYDIVSGDNGENSVSIRLVS